LAPGRLPGGAAPRGDAELRLEYRSPARIAWALVFLACQGPLSAPVPPAGGGPCADLAHIFFLVADQRDHGTPRDALIRALRTGVDSPFAIHPNATFRDLLRVVDLVYRRRDAKAPEIEAMVRHDCVVDGRGRPVLRTLWPRQVARQPTN
jgi:hypothetical protein